MKSIEKSVIDSLDGKSLDLYPFIPYLMQDLREMGTPAKEVIDILAKNGFTADNSIRVIDLGCGKGAVSVALAKEFDCKVLGIDAVPQFIEDARKSAVKEKVSDKCSFEIGDIREVLKTCNDYDLVILGAIGYIFGNLQDTLEMTKKCMKDSGYILMDDAYMENGKDLKSSIYLRQDHFFATIDRCKMQIVDETVFDAEYVLRSNAKIFSHIKRRAEELIKKYPEKKGLFKDYIKRQAEENEILQKQVRCILLFLKNRQG